LTAGELARLATALVGLRDQGAANAVRLLLLTGARRGELLAARWADIDLAAGVWTKPSATTKQAALHRVPLSTAACTLLAGMKEHATSEWLFPTPRHNGRHRLDIDDAWEVLRKAANIPDVCSATRTSICRKARSTRQTFTLNTNDQLFKPDQYADLVIAYRNGSPVRIRDIGRAISAGENELIAAWFNQKRAILLSIQRQPGANVIETVGRVKAMLPVLEASIPPAVKVNIISDRIQTIRASVADVQFTLTLSVALVVMVIFLFPRNFWATVIPAVTVPLSLIGTFAVLYELGYSLDNLSLMALSIAVGFVVDDAVVEIENIVRHMEEGLSPYDAAMNGSGEIGFTVMAITFSLIAVFIPLFT
jgi:AcrB/AcrD/AcrF family/Phage integrase family